MSNPICSIVGAGEGLGQSLAAKFAREGFDIGLISRSSKGSSAAVDAASKARSGTKINFYVADATQPETIEQAFFNLVEEMGDVNVLIYNVCNGFPRCAHHAQIVR